MSPRRVWAVSRKELLHILRDPRSLAMAIAIPIMLLSLFGYALTLDVDDVPMVVWDQDNSQASRELVARFTGSRYFLLKGTVWNYRDLERAVDDRTALVGLVIPLGFAGQVESGRAVPVQLLVDGSDSNTATIATGYAEVVALTYSEDVVLRATRQAGEPRLRTPIDVRPRVWFNADLESKNYVIPGLIALIMMVIAALITSLTIAREWERGTMEQLISTPVRGPELILGKLIPYFAIGMLDLTIAVLMGQFLFHVPLRGNAALLFGISSVFLIGALSLGLLISVVARNQLMANQIAMVATFLPTFLLSGFMYAIPNMPTPVQALTHVIPARYFISALRAIYLKGAGLEILAVDALLLVVFGAGVFALANRKFRKKL